MLATALCLYADAKIDEIGQDEAHPLANLAEALAELHGAGFQTVGLDSAGASELETSFSGEKIALVLGAEGKGLRQRTRESVTSLARLEMPGAIRSLNVSNAAAIALYAAKRFLKT
jgi:23S rRNA (guanosine2251-2'-O)-methyltransferase